MENKENKIVNILIEICKLLYSQETIIKINKTDDFLIYPVHYELADFNRNIKKLYGQSKLNELKAKKLAF